MKKVLSLLLVVVFVIGICASAPITITANAADDTKNITQTGEYTLDLGEYTFTPTETGYYTFESFSSYDPKIQIVIDGESYNHDDIDFSTDNYNFKLCVYIEANNSAEFILSDYDNAAETVPFSITYEGTKKPEWYDDATSEKTNLTQTGEYTLVVGNYTFTPTTTGYYTFESFQNIIVGWTNPYINITIDDLYYRHDNIDCDNDNYNFKLCVYIEANASALIELGDWDGDIETTVPFSITYEGTEKPEWSNDDNDYDDNDYDDDDDNGDNTVINENGFSVEVISTDSCEITDYDDSNLTNGALVIPQTIAGYKVTSIGNNAFKNCNNLTSVTIPDSVTSIGYEAFMGCTSLTSVTIPASTTTVNVPVANCAINVDANNPNYSSENGVLFNKDKTELISYPFSNPEGSYVTPSSVKSVGSHAFSGVTLKSLTFSDSVTQVRLDALQNSKIVDLIYGNGIKEVNLDRALIGSQSIENITIGSSVSEVSIETDCKTINVNSANPYFTSVDGVLFSKDKTELVRFPFGKEVTSYTIPSYVTMIGFYAFSGCTGLTSITIPNSVTSIGSDAFSGCDNLTSVTLGNGVKVISDSAFYHCNSLSSITIPDSVKAIGVGAFALCDNLSSVKLGNGVKAIGDNAFYSCDKLTSIVIPDSVTSIDRAAFQDCTNLATVTIGNGVKKISSAAFVSTAFYNNSSNWENGLLYIGSYLLGAKDVTNVTVKEGTKIAADGVFYNVEGVETITLPSSLTSLGSTQFMYDTEDLVAVNVGADNKNYSSVDGVLFNKSKTELIYYPTGKTNTSYTISTGVKTISSSAFESNKNLTSVVIPDSVETIGDWAFNNCTYLDSVTIGKGVKVINYAAFSACESLTSVVIPDGVTTIDAFAFSDCTKLATVTIPDSVTEMGHGVFDGTAIYNNTANYVDGALYIGNHLIKVKNESVDGNYVIKSGTKTISNAFECDYLQSVTIPDSVVSIGSFAFDGCYNLNSVTIPNSVRYIGYSAFGDCEKITTVTIPDSVISLGENTFENTALYDDEANWENGALYLGNILVSVSEDITSDYTIKDGTKVIADGAFSYNEKLTSVTIPDSVITIGEYAFYKCNLKSITIPETVTTIGDCAIGYGNGYHTESALMRGFEIFGVKGSAAETYAKDNDITFVSVTPHNHSYTSKITKQPTCTGTGTKTFTCSCGDSYTETLPATGHKEVTVTGKAATCTATGLTDGKKCSVCGTVTKAQETIKAKGHTTSVINKKDATCTVDGYTGDTYCSVCKTTVTKGKAITKLGHSYNAGEITTKATCEKDGVKTFTCTRCKDAKTETVKATGHNEVVIPAVAPTYTTVGKTEGKKCSVCGTITVAQKDVAKLTLATPVVTVKNSATGVKVTWNAIDGATSYKVYRKTYNTKTKKYGSWKTCGTVTTTSYVDATAKSGTKYIYTVKAFNNDTKSDIKNSSSILYLAQPTVKIANASTGVKVSWNKITGATSYKVYRAEYTNGKWTGWKSVKTINKGSTVSWTDKSVKSGVKYKYTVKAVNGKTASTYKSSSSLLYLVQPKTTVKAVSNGVKVTWTQITGATSYKVYRSEYNAKTKKWSSWKGIKTAKSTSKSYTDKTVKKGVKYRYTVKAVNGKVASTYKSSASVKR